MRGGNREAQAMDEGAIGDLFGHGIDAAVT